MSNQVHDQGYGRGCETTSQSPASGQSLSSSPACDRHPLQMACCESLSVIMHASSLLCDQAETLDRTALRCSAKHARGCEWMIACVIDDYPVHEIYTLSAHLSNLSLAVRLCCFTFQTAIRAIPSCRSQISAACYPVSPNADRYLSGSDAAKDMTRLSGLEPSVTLSLAIGTPVR
jgi:hypothetical protein